jgi:HEAT repeat protein
MSSEFSTTNDAQFIAQIEKELRANGLDRRKIALDKLATLPAEIAIPVLTALAQEPEFVLRRMAVMGLSNYPTEDSLQVLQQLLSQENDPNVQAEIANSLFEFGDRALPLLEQLFQRSSNWLVRQTVISLLADTTYYEALLMVAQQAALGEDEEQAVHEAGILALGRLLRSPLCDPALAVLTKLAKDPEWRTRWRVAIALQNRQTPETQALISQFQQDEHFRVVAAALEVATHWQTAGKQVSE